MYHPTSTHAVSTFDGHRPPFGDPAFPDDLAVTLILSAYRFSQYEPCTLRRTDGQAVQCAMLVQSPLDAGDWYVVSCSIETGEEEWSAECPAGNECFGSAMIEAVRRRVAANRAQRMPGLAPA
jgi:hypothetical protein